MRYEVDVQGRRRTVHLVRENDRFAVEVDGRQWSVDVVRVDGHTLSLLLLDGTPTSPALAGGHSREVTLASNPGVGTLTARIQGTPIVVTPHTRRRSGGRDASVDGGPQRLTAPMPGKVVRVLVKVGDPVVARQPLVVVEAMKMENELRALRDGQIAEIAVRDGQSVEAGTLLAVIADR